MIRSSVNLDCFISVSLKVTDPTHLWRKFRGSGHSTWAMLLLGFVGIGFMAYRRKAKPALMAA